MLSHLRTARVLAAMTLICAAIATPTSQAAAQSPADAPSPIQVALSAQATTIAVDDVHRQVFVAEGGGVTQVFGFDGALRRDSLATGGILAFVMSSDGDTIYGADPFDHAIDAIDTSTFAISVIPTPGLCPASITYTGGKVWFASSPYPGNACPSGLFSYDAATSTVSDPSTTYGWVTSVTALADRPQRMIATDDATRIDTIDVSGSAPSPVATASSGFGVGALVDNGDHLISTGIAGGGAFRVYRTSDLTNATGFGQVFTGHTIAVSSDGRFVATMDTGQSAVVTDIGGGFPGVTLRRNTFAGMPSAVFLAGYALALSAFGPMFVGMSVSSGYELEIFPGAATYVPGMSLHATSYHPNLNQNLDLFGTVGHPVPGTAMVTLRQADADGVLNLGQIQVQPDGSFGVMLGDGRVRGRVTYTVTYPGDATDLATTGTISVTMETVDDDVNGDGYADLAIGAPKEDDGTVVDGGVVDVLYGSATGPSGTGSIDISQGTPGVPGTTETGDEFGYATASGDFNGDGYADLAVSAPYKEVNGMKDAGEVWIFHGSASGLTVADAVVLTGPSEGAEFGQSLAAGDFGQASGDAFVGGADGYDDLAIGAPGAGVYIDSGATNTVTRIIANSNDPGLSLAAGDVNGDGQDELAIGEPTYTDTSNHGSGGVRLLAFAGGGFAGYDETLTMATAGVPGTASAPSVGRPDSFGAQVVLSDLTGNGMADLAVSAPGAPVTTSDGVKHEDAGTVTVLYSDGTKISTTNAVRITQSTTGVPGSPGNGDQLGAALAAGPGSVNGMNALAMFSPGDRWVTVIPAGEFGLEYSESVAFNQSSAGIAGIDTVGDQWGAYLRFEPFKGYYSGGLAVGAPGKHAGAGSVTIMYPSMSGMTGTGSRYFDQDSSGIPGAAEPGDAFGTF